MNKKLKKLLELRKALLNNINAVLTEVETSSDKKETPAQKTKREGFETELRALDVQIETAEAAADRESEQIELEKRHAGRRTVKRPVHSGNAKDNEEEDEEADPEDRLTVEQRDRLVELEGNRKSLSREERVELRHLQQLDQDNPEPGKDKKRLNGSGDMYSGPSSRELRDLQGFSLVRAFRQTLDEKKLDGLEGEMNDEGVKQYAELALTRNAGSFIVPPIVLRYSGISGSYEKRDLTATGSTGSAGDQGGLTIQTTVGSLIDRLRNALVMRQMGVTMLGGLVGNIDFPKIIADDEAAERAENATAPESSPTFSKISLAPRRLPVYAEISRQLLMQSTADVEAWVRNDLAFQIAQVMDQRMIAGTGSGQPFGILNTTGVGAITLGTNGAAPTWDMLVDLETTVASLNADFGALGYITNTKVRGKLKKTLVANNTAGEMIWDKRSPASPLNEYQVGITNLVPSNGTKNAGTNLSSMIFGNFNDVLVGQWGGLEFLANPYSRDTEGLIRLNVWTFFDLVLRRLESFAVCKDIVT